MTIIPPENIYYMLSYSLGIRPDRKGRIDGETFNHNMDVLAKILARCMSHVLKGGLIKDYAPRDECVSKPRGHIDLNKTIKQGSTLYGKYHCIHYEYNPDTYDNSFIVSVMDLMILSQDIRPEIRDELKSLRVIMGDIKSIKLNHDSASKIKYRGRNEYYISALTICRLYLNNMIPSKGSTFLFGNYTNEEKNHLLFERFVRGYYAIEYPDIYRNRRGIEWGLTNGSKKGFLPNMEVDILLEHDDTSLIIDTKYYSNILNELYGIKKLKSSNIYQICNYVGNYAFTSGNKVSGLLLYARTDESVQSESYEIMGNKISVDFLDLGSTWSQIESHLMTIADTIYE